MRIKNYVRPQTVEEAYEILSKNEKSVILGGGTFLRLFIKDIDTVIDLQDTGLDFLEENEDTIDIGAMVTLGELERNEHLNEMFHGYISKFVSIIWSVQLRNLATVGGTIFPKWGFSDFITGLLALDVDVHLHRSGVMKLEEFLKSDVKRDILVKISIKKEKRRASFQFLRNSLYDFSILNLSLSFDEEKRNFRIAVGARPGIAKLADKTMNFLNSSENSSCDVEKAVEILLSEVEFGDDFRASGEYRKHLAGVLLRRAIEEVLDHES